jgi:four helix bundle protein
MSITRFEDLEVWQEAASLAVEVYAVSKNGDFNQDFAFRDQLRRSAVSIAANIAEGKERETMPEFIRYL